MNKITLTTLLILVLSFFSWGLMAQDGYTYTLVDNGGYNYSVSAVPNASASNFATSVQSYGFTILVPDGITGTITSSLGNGAGATFFNGTDVGMPTVDGYLITETLGSPASLPGPSSGMATPMITFQINGSPTSGTMIILANDSALANAITPLKSFMQADMIDDASAMFTNVVDPNASGLSGVTSIDFSTLSIPTLELEGVLAYPNPTKNILTIKGIWDIEFVEVYNINGQKVLRSNLNSETIDLSALESGVYFARVQARYGIKTLKIIKE